MYLGPNLVMLILVWGATMEEQLFQLINVQRFSKGCLDTWNWKEDEKGVFSVKSPYNKLQGNFEEKEDKVFKMLWNTRVTHKAQLLGWRITLDKLPTKNKLIVRGIQLHTTCVSWV